METNWNYYYGIAKRFLLLTGQWPYQNRNERLFRMSLIMTAILFMLVPQICKFFRCDRDVVCILKIVPVYVLSVVIIVKLYTGQFKISKIKFLIDCVLVNWERLQNPEEYEIMETYVANARWIIVVHSVSCMTGTVFFVSLSFIPQILDVVLPLNESRPIMLPFEGYFFVDERKYFFHILLYSLVIGILTMLGLVAYDAMLMSFIEHACGVFTVAGSRFERLVCKNVVEVVNNDMESTYNKRMAHCVDVHCAALQFSEYLENIFSINFGVQLLLVVLVMSITLFEITVHSSNIVEVLRHVSYTCAQMIHLFVLCWEGQKLIDHSLQMHEKIYNCTWYKIPVKSQRLILHVMKRSLRPKFISAGRIFIFSLQGFTAVKKQLPR